MILDHTSIVAAETSTETGAEHSGLPEMSNGALVAFIGLQLSFICAVIKLIMQSHVGEATVFIGRWMSTIARTTCYFTGACIGAEETLSGIAMHFHNAWVAVFALIMIRGIRRYSFPVYVMIDMFNTAVAVLMEGWVEAAITVSFTYALLLILYRINGVRVMRITRNPAVVCVISMHIVGVIAYFLLSSAVPMPQKPPVPLWVWMTVANMSVVVLVSAATRSFYSRKDTPAFATRMRSLYVFTRSAPSWRNLFYWQDVLDDACSPPAGWTVASDTAVRSARLEQALETREALRDTAGIVNYVKNIFNENAIRVLNRGSATPSETARSIPTADEASMVNTSRADAGLVVENNAETRTLSSSLIKPGSPLPESPARHPGPPQRPASWAGGVLRQVSRPLVIPLPRGRGGAASLRGLYPARPAPSVKARRQPSSRSLLEGPVRPGETPSPSPSPPLGRFQKASHQDLGR